MNLTLELLAGTLLAVLSVALVLEPLFRPPEVSDVSEAEPAGADDWDADIAHAATPRARALAALREIEFDRETGKLDDNDYETLKARYTREAIEAMRADEATPAAPAIDVPEPAMAAMAAVAAGEAGEADALEALAEARITKARARAAAPRAACPTCGPRPESEATFCSKCGRPLVA